MKILCLGNNTDSTDLQTKALAAENGMLCHGLLSELDQKFSELEYELPGYYHTSLVDIQHGNLITLMNNFDQVIMLDQPIEQWNHPNEFYLTIKLLQKTTTPVVYINPALVEPVLFFSKLVETNKSFCIFPFIELHTGNGHTRLCCRSSKLVVPVKEFKDFESDQSYKEIRKKMLEGVMIPEYCHDCYDRESKGHITSRLSETPEWANRLGLKNLNDLLDIKKPAFYDLRPSDKCNLLCRSCNPSDSHLIKKEYKKLGLIVEGSTIGQKHVPGEFDLVDFENIRKISVAGGEPTIMPEFFDFLEKCIRLGRTEFEVNVTTNGTNLSERLKELVKNFKDFSWIFSVDGFKELNHYMRFPSNWDDIVRNWKFHKENKNPVTVNTTISIYNVNSLDVLFQWMDQEFPSTIMSCATVSSPPQLHPLLFPDRDSALRSLGRVKKTNCYLNNDQLRTTIDWLFGQFEQRAEPNEPLLRHFFQFNDTLDQNRKIYLKDYVPDLEKYRSRYGS